MGGTHPEVISNVSPSIIYLKEGGPPFLNLEHQRKWVKFEAIIQLKDLPGLDFVLRESLNRHTCLREGGP